LISDAVKSFCVVVVTVVLVIGTKFSHPCLPAGVNDQVPAPISSLIHGTVVFQPVKWALRHPVRLQPAAVIYAQNRGKLAFYLNEGQVTKYFDLLSFNHSQL